MYHATFLMLHKTIKNRIEMNFLLKYRSTVATHFERIMDFEFVRNQERTWTNNNCESANFILKITRGPGAFFVPGTGVSLQSCTVFLLNREGTQIYVD